MSDLAASGSISESIDAFMTLLSNVPAFQTFTGTANAADARARIFRAQVGTAVKSVSVSSGVLTVALARPMKLSVGQWITLAGHDVGSQGLKIAGTWQVSALGDAVQIPWTDAYGNVWTNAAHTPWTYPGEQVLSFTAAINAADLAESTPEGAVVLPCARPLAAVANNESALKSLSVSTGGGALISGEILILIEARVSMAYRHDEVNAQMEADNAAGSLVQGLSVLSGVNEYLLLRNVGLARSPKFVDMGEQDSNIGNFELWDAVLSVAWGFE